MGSKYGLKTYVPSDKLVGCAILSAGCGEDISLDTEFAARWNANIILIDPTPRAIEHVKLIMAAIGQHRSQPWNNSGKQDLTSYDLSKVAKSQLKLVEAALWDEEGSIDIFPPKEAQHVSHSISDLQNNRAKISGALHVNSRTIESIMKEFDLPTIEIVKLDIEGAEVEVLDDMFSNRIFPNQILVEFDEVLYPSRTSQDRINHGFEAVKNNGYECFSKNHADFSFFRSAAE